MSPNLIIGWIEKLATTARKPEWAPAEPMHRGTSNSVATVGVHSQKWPKLR